MGPKSYILSILVKQSNHKPTSKSNISKKFHSAMKNGTFYFIKRGQSYLGLWFDCFTKIDRILVPDIE